MRFNPRSTWTLLASSLCLLGAAGAARAQNALGNGRALDNNLQSGTGGVNASQAPIDYAARNNLITGNVAGLGQFRGQVGYRAPGEFSGSTGSDSLFRFNAQSYPVGQGARPVTQSPAISVFRSEAPTLAGQVSQISAANPIILPRQAAPGLWTTEPLGQRFNPQAAGSTRGVLGTVQQAEGRLLELSASPLLGVRLDDLRSAPSATDSGTLFDPRNPNRRDNTLQQNTLEVSPPSRRIDDPAPAGEPGSNRPLGQFAPSLTLGEQIQTQLGAPGSTLATGGADQAAARMQAALFSPLGSASAAPGEDAYLDLLRRIQRNRDLAAGRPVEPAAGPVPSNMIGVAPQPGTPGAAGTPGAPAGAAPDTMQPPLGGTPPISGSPSAEISAALPTPSAQELEAARAARNNAMRTARGLPLEKPAPGTPGATDPAADPAQRAPGSDPASPSSDAAPLPGRLGDLVSTLNYSLPPLPTLAGRREDRLNTLLRAAEADMATGRYFDAEAHYRQAQTIAPDQPLATIGLIHAQMGAGLVRSASLNLRTVLERRPEIIATRYDASLLPKADRLERVRKELQELTRTSGRPEPPMLLAYLGHQLNNPAIVQLGLDQAQASAPNDALLVLLRRIWITNRAEPANAPAPKTPAPGSPPAGPATTPAPEISK